MLACGRAPAATAPSAELDDAVVEPNTPRPALPPAAASCSKAWRSSFGAGTVAAAAAWAHAAEPGPAGPAGVAAVARALARLRSAPPPAAASAEPPGAPARRAALGCDTVRTPTLPLPSPDALSHSAPRATGRAAAPVCPPRAAPRDRLAPCTRSGSGATGMLPARGGGAARGCGAGWGAAAGPAERAAPGAARARASSARQAASSVRHTASSAVTCRRHEASRTGDASAVRSSHWRAACSRSMLHANVPPMFSQAGTAPVAAHGCAARSHRCWEELDEGCTSSCRARLHRGARTMVPAQGAQERQHLVQA